MKNLLIFAVFSLIAASAFPQDPGMPDTVIVDTVYADLGQSYVDVNIFAVTDDTVMVYNMPISWSSSSEGIEASDVLYYNMIERWMTLDSILVSEGYIRMVGWGDGLFFLNTFGYRLRCWSIRFTIDSLALPQIVTIDTTYDPINGSLLFGLLGGIESFAPEFIPGAIYYGSPADIDEYERIFPSRINLSQNYPNPFNASTTIEFSLPEEAYVDLSIYDLLGREVTVLEKGLKPAGKYEIPFDASGLSSGVYFYRLQAGESTESKRMVLLK
jgi:hypothetical protein